MIEETDDGTWRRVVLVKFPYHYLEAGQEPKGPNDREGDQGLRDRCAHSPAVLAATLAWMVQGARRWYEMGKVMPALPERVRADTDAWRAELTAARRAAHRLTALGRARVFHVPGADGDADPGDRNYLVLARPNVIMNDIRLRGLAVAGSDAAGRKSSHNHAQTARNLRRSLRNAASGARLIQPEALDSESADDLAASLAAGSRSSVYS